MFAQEYRLDRAAFTHTYKHGRRVHMPSLLLIYLNAPVQNNSTCKVAVVVGKKVAKSAAARNMLKRRLYTALYESKWQSGHIIVIAKPPAKAYSYTELHIEVVVALGRAVGARALSR